MGKTYNVILQSLIGNGASNASETYFYDWSRLPDVPYKLTFTYNSAVVTLSLTTVASIYINLTQPYCNIASDQSGLVIGYRGDFLGSLYHTQSTTAAYLSANLTSNPPIYLEGRPRNNNFMVQILGGVDIAYPNVLGNYQLILNFEECN